MRVNSVLRIYLFLWFTAFFLYKKYNNIYLLLLPYVFTIVNEIIYINTNKSLLSVKDTTEIFYLFCYSFKIVKELMKTIVKDTLKVLILKIIIK